MIVEQDHIVGPYRFQRIKAHGGTLFWRYTLAGNASEAFQSLEDAMRSAAASPSTSRTATPFGDLLLRDWFAGQAAAAEVASAGANLDAARALNNAASKADRTIEQQIAWNAYQVADAMLEARKR